MLWAMDAEMVLGCHVVSVLLYPLRHFLAFASLGTSKVAKLRGKGHVAGKLDVD